MQDKAAMLFELSTILARIEEHFDRGWHDTNSDNDFERANEIIQLLKN